MEKTESPLFDIPAQLEYQIEHLLKARGASLQNHKKIAEAILKQSDFYIQQPESSTPWKENWSQIAQAAYYLPLNYIRFAKIMKEAQRINFFEGLKSFFDFGSGLGAASLHLERTIEEGICVENNSVAEQMHKQIQPSRSLKWTRAMYEVLKPRESLAVFSYSLTEQSQIPKWALDCEALIIMEPSTHQDGRKLLETRSKLIKQDFYIWAPCLHQGGCPMLKHSQRDWCHDRVLWKMPEWFKDIENHLPMKNKTLTFSYLMARKKESPEKFSGNARLVGDIQEEKGKSKIMICRGEQREFLSWLHKDIKEQNLSRGDIVSVPLDVEIKSTELRTKTRL